MNEPFIGQIQLFPYNFEPRNWAFCEGQLIPIQQNPALFSTVFSWHSQEAAMMEANGWLPLK